MSRSCEYENKKLPLIQTSNIFRYDKKYKKTTCISPSFTTIRNEFKISCSKLWTCKFLKYWTKLLIMWYPKVKFTKTFKCNVKIRYSCLKYSFGAFSICRWPSKQTLCIALHSRQIYQSITNRLLKVRFLYDDTCYTCSY